jgi:uncharacterized membrane protein
MLPVLLAAFLLGIVAGLRTFTAPAVLWLIRHGGIWAWVLAAAAAIEYAGDLHPKAPARTRAVGLTARVISGAFVGGAIGASSGQSAIPGIVAGVVGAMIGAYGGLAMRVRLVAVMGNVPSGILEDVVAILAAVLIVTHV